MSARRGQSSRRAVARWAGVRWAGVMLGIALALATSLPACAQSLERQLEAQDGPAQFHFAARAGVCGNGRTYLRADDDSWYGSWSSSSDGAMRSEGCERGPVRVVVTRAGRDLVKVQAYAGPLSNDPDGGRDLGAVPAAEAANYLLSLAASADGRPAREALLPAMLADSARVTPSLLTMVRNPALSRDLRRSALSWLSRRRAEPGGVGATGVAQALNAIVRDRDEPETLRQSAMSLIAQEHRGEGIPALIAFAGDKDAWISRHALGSLARSGDPRARAFVRSAVARGDLADELRAELIRGLGGEYATGADFRALRELYPALGSDRARDAVISALSQAGGKDNIAWLVTLARSPTETVARRRRVVTALARSDDPRVKDLLTELLDRRP
ncbi:MAG: HEAT repeat domain-containing protein [Gemmatimonadaceae bacterium]|nr:HEAT repeat domain-containing protein [Gemmatimonadaceae bacterium]